VVYTVPDDYSHPVEPTDAMTFSQYGVTDFNVQGWDGSQWVTLATVTGNNRVKRTVTFAPFTTSKIRINVTNAMYYVSRITEVEAWGVPAAPAPVNVALQSFGGYATASSTLNAGYLAYYVNQGNCAGRGWTLNGGWADGTVSQWPDWVQVSLDLAKTVSRVVVCTVQDDYANPVEPTDTTTFTKYGVTDFQVQGWDGSQWVTLATVSGNNLVKRTVSFAPFTTSMIRVNVTGALSYVSRVTDLQVWGR
jgi:hypothetical protein